MKHVVFFIGSVFLCPCAYAQADKYHVTPAEQAACQQDAVTLCSDAYPDEDQLLVCMKGNKALLSKTCLKSFEAGLKKRHLL